MLFVVELGANGAVCVSLFLFTKSIVNLVVGGWLIVGPPLLKFYI